MAFRTEEHHGMIVASSGAFRCHCEPTGRANARPMTGSAKQSILPRKERMDCFGRGVYHRAGRRPDPLAPRNDEKKAHSAGLFNSGCVSL